MSKEKILIFDASTLINFAMNGLLKEFEKLKKIFNGKFIITKEVKSEIIDRPITIKRFELEALKIKRLLDENILELSSSLNIKDKEISEKTEKMLDLANNIFHSSNRNIHLIDLGETSCLVLSKILTEKGIENVIAVDERTTRMLVENPKNLKKLFEKKLHIRISSNKNNYKFFKGFNFIRSAELVYVIYRKNLMNIQNKNLLDSLLYAVKFKGCSISKDEIEEIKKMKI